MARKLNKAKKAEGSLVSRQRKKLESQRAAKRTQESDAERARKAANATKYEQEKAAREARGGKGYGGGYSQHLMGGNVRSSSYDRHSGTIVHEQILSYLLDEGFASDEKSAEAIMDAMSEAWIESIVEAKVDKKLPEHERSGARLNRYDNPSGALALGGGQQRARRAEHEERRGKKK
jgi:hypothetical protein